MRATGYRDGRHPWESVLETGKFTLRPDPAERLLEIVLEGHWTPETVAAYRLARADVMRALQRAGVMFADLRVFVDARALSPQSLEAVEAFGSTVAQSHLQPGRSALVLSSTLVKLQIRRVAMPGQRLFDDEQEARAWLVDETTAGDCCP